VAFEDRKCFHEHDNKFPFTCDEAG